MAYFLCQCRFSAFVNLCQPSPVFNLPALLPPACAPAPIIHDGGFPAQIAFSWHSRQMGQIRPFLYMWLALKHPCFISEHGCSLALHGCLVFQHGCNKSLLGCLVSEHGCSLALHGCLAFQHGCNKSLLGCLASEHGCSLALHGCLAFQHGCSVSLHGCLTVQAVQFPGMAAPY